MINELFNKNRALFLDILLILNAKKILIETPIVNGIAMFMKNNVD